MILGLGNNDEPRTVETRENNMLVTFKSDFEHSGSGFKANYITESFGKH